MRRRRNRESAIEITNQQTMSTHLTRDLGNLHRNLLAMCTTVEDLVHKAVDELADPSMAGARELAKRDDEVDRFDVSIEEECLKILALHQPVATDLRRITTVLKISSELERVADISVHIAERATSLVEQPGIVVPEKMKEMTARAVEMLHKSIDAYVALDSQLARNIIESDSAVDALNREIIAELVVTMQNQPDLIEPAMSLFSATRHVERVADHATNIAEDVVYLVEGEIIRHRAHFR
jgi:phosphate transport system protein